MCALPYTHSTHLKRFCPWMQALLQRYSIDYTNACSVDQDGLEPPTSRL